MLFFDFSALWADYRTVQAHNKAPGTQRPQVADILQELHETNQKQGKLEEIVFVEEAVMLKSEMEVWATRREKLKHPHASPFCLCNYTTLNHNFF